MKFFKLVKLFSSILLCLIFSILICAPYGSVIAATSGGYIVDYSMLDGSKESMRKWQLRYDTGVNFSNNTMFFDSDYDINNPILAWQKAYSSKEVLNTLEVSFTISINTITDGKTFGFCYGIKTLMDDVGIDDSTYIYFAKLNEGIGYGIKTYKQSEEINLYSLTELPCDKNNISIKLIVECNGKLKLFFNNEVVYYSQEENETNPEGHVGFSSTGSLTTPSKYIDLHIKDLIVFNSYYDKPESPLFSMVNFDDAEFNVNEWCINSTYVKDGQGVLMENGSLHFKDSGQNSTFTNRFRHSNFELQFEVYGARNYPKITSDGRISCASHYLGINWGLDGDSAEGVGAGYSSESFLYFDSPINLDFVNDEFGNEIYSEHFGERIGETRMTFLRQSVGYIKTNLIIPSKYAFLNKDFNPETRVRIRIRVVDGIFTLGMKLDTELNYTEIYSYTYPLNLVSTGYISIRGEGNQFVSNYKKYVQGTDFYIDDIVIVNFDKNPNIVEVKYKTNRATPIPDYEYIDPYTDDYLITNTGGKSSKK